MSGERYVGERRALRHFLIELRPLVITVLGNNSVLRFRIDQALKVGDLDSLRKARETFHNQPEDLKRQLMRGIFDGPHAKADGERLPVGMQGKPPEPFVRIDASTAGDTGHTSLSAELIHATGSQGRDGIDLRVLIRTGTLPSNAADILRRVASWLERDRRVLSTHHWDHAAPRKVNDPATAGGSEDNVDQA